MEKAHPFPNVLAQEQHILSFSFIFCWQKQGTWLLPRCREGWKISPWLGNHFPMTSPLHEVRSLQLGVGRRVELAVSVALRKILGYY